MNGTDYEILMEEHAVALEQKVTEYMRDGYIPAGAPWIRQAYGQEIWIQAVCRVLS